LLQEWGVVIEQASSLGAMMLAAWQLAGMLAVNLVEEELRKRAQRPTEWPACEVCGKRLESKGFVKRTLRGLIGTVRWERRVGHCPDRCKIDQVAPLDTELGLKPNQRASANLMRAACALALFVPFEEATVLLTLLTGVVLSPASIWIWVQAVGGKAKARLERQLKELEAGEGPEAEEIAPQEVRLKRLSCPCSLGPMGSWCPFDPMMGSPRGAPCGEKSK